ncbi:MAG TPA: type II toxin-antitoxin system death-on-curing family toxin [Candidatus Methanoperedens sp.]
MLDLNTQKIIRIHDIIIEFDKGTTDYLPGIRDLGTLDHLIEYQIKPENDVIKNASFALHSITDRHAFNNGNKRTGFAIASIILESERYHITANGADRLNFLLKIARYETNVEDIEIWLKENTYKMGKIRYILHIITYIVIGVILGIPLLLLIQAKRKFKNNTII